MSGSAFSVPFTITNRSFLFDIEHVHVSCGFNAEWENRLSAINGLGTSTTLTSLAAGESKQILCAADHVVGVTGHALMGAEILLLVNFRYSYKPGIRKHMEERYTWNVATQQWLKGGVIL
jgi:hypothetical protein